MVLLLKKIKESYNFVFYELADANTRDMFLSPITIMTILSLYIYYVTDFGPRLMRDRKPFKLRTTIFYYNLFQISMCLYIIYLAIKGGWLNGYSFVCQPADYSDNPQARTMTNAVWWYSLLKLIDLLDTVFFVLRKKNEQISFLHVFHHSIMVFVASMGLRFFSSGHGTFSGFVNCIVHVFMYTYYLIAGLGPKYQKYLWWKKYITTLQLIQFCMVFVQNFAAVCDSTCKYPRWITFASCIQCLHFIYMFGSFYINKYIQQPRKDDNETDQTPNKNLKCNK